MKLSNKEIQKAFENAPLPKPSENSRKEALQRATDEFSKKTTQTEKNSKGFILFLRRIGNFVSQFCTIKGEPIMTRTSFATIGVAVIAVGLFLTVGTNKQLFTIKKDYTAEKLIEKIQSKNSIELGQLSGATKPTKREKSMTAEVDVYQQVQPQLSQQVLMNEQSTGAGLKKYELADYDSITQVNKAPGISRSIVQSRMLMGRRFTQVPERPRGSQYKDEGRDIFSDTKANPVKIVAEQPVSTFSIDVDSASYGFVRKQLNTGVLPQKNAVRIEEMINYFDYDYALPEDKLKPFAPTVAIYPTPWNSNTKILHVGIKGYDVPLAKKPTSNLVFLIDVSGSMNSPDKLPLLKNSFSMLVNSLSLEDTVGIVVYAGAAGTVLEPTKVKEKGKILAALDRLRAGGSTAGGAGIDLAYSLAEMNFDKEAVNRIILATDGDFNIGISNQNELKSYIERKRKTGIFLSVLGFGQGNYNDALMQTLAQNGNGTAAYIDTLNEARKVLVEEANSMLFTIAKDVKIQVEFNPTQVHDYRLIGYETRMLNREDFNNDQVDAGDVGSGASVTALYEITPVSSKEKLVDSLRYQAPKKETEPETITSEYAFLKIRYKLPNSDTSNLITKPVGTDMAYHSAEKIPTDFRFAASVAAFGQLLRDDPYTKDFKYDDVLELAEPARGRDLFGYRAEFLNLIRLAKSARDL